MVGFDPTAMIMYETRCFSTEELRRYLLGELPESASDAVALHVERCSQCETTVSRLDRESDTLIQAIRNPIAQEEPASAYRLAAKLAKSKWHDAAPEASSPSVSKLPKLRDYELLEPLARGGMGTVYRARHTRLNRQVALKVLPGRWLSSPAAVARFEREMHAVGSLHHPAIVQATDGGEADGVHFLVMELIDGIDGGSLVQLVGPLPIADACEIARQAAEGMAYVHRQGIIHRDLKPSNLMVTQKGEVKLLDLGLARLVDEQLAGDELTTIGQLMGTLDYMSPEQLENSHDADRRADLYSLGATLFKLLTGNAPHASDFSEPFLSKIRRIASQPPTPLSERRADAPGELCGLVDSLLSRHAGDRPDSMESVFQSLAKLAEPSNLERLVKKAKKLQKQRQNDATANHRVLTSPLVAVSPQQTVAAAKRSRPLLTGAAALLMLMAIAMGAVITLQLNSGQLVIETATPNVEVRILKAGQPYRQLTLSHKPNLLSLGAGDYEIEIVSNADGLDVENGQFTLKRGDTWLAKIVHRDNSADITRQISEITEPSTSNEITRPTYEGKTLNQWLTLLRTERSAQQVYEACEALQKLDAPDDTDTVQALLHAVRYHSGGSYIKTDDGDTSTIWNSIQYALAGRDQRVVANELTNCLKKSDNENLAFILRYVADFADRLRPAASEPLIEQLRRIADDPLSDQRIAGIRAIQAIAAKEVVTRTMAKALQSDDAAVQLYAAGALSEMQVHTDDIITTLRQIVVSSDLESRAEAAWRLGELGSAAQSALPELIQCVTDEDSAVRLAAAYRTPTRTVSVKDAAIDALAKLGAPSVAPLLIDEWNRRAYHNQRTIGSDEPWRQQYSAVSGNDADWLANAIERLIGRRPDKVRGPRGVYVTVWSIKGRSLGEIVRTAFDARYRRNTDGLIESAEQLLPLSHPFQLEDLFNEIRNAVQFPNDEDLALEVRMLELLAKYDDPKDVLRPLYARRTKYQSIIIEQSESTRRMKTLQEYRSLANRILQEQPTWKTEYVPFLIQLVEDRYAGAAVSLLDLIDEFAFDQQVDGVVKVFHLIQGLGARELGDSTEGLQSWLEVPANREAIQKHLREDSSSDWLALVGGIYRWGGDDTLATDIVMERFENDSINRNDLFNELVRTLDAQPHLSELLVELINRPLLNQAITTLGPAGKATTSMRAYYVTQVLSPIGEQHRHRFRPMLKALAESGKDGEAEAAKLLLDQWK